jgi:hypothetical protein
MKKLKTYDLFFESFQKETGISHEYSIYDWFEDLKGMQWSKSPTNLNSVKFWSEHFIGNGWYDKISKLVDDAYTSLQKVDIDFINDKMLEVWDQLPMEKDKYAITSIAYGSFGSINKDDYFKYSGTITIKDPNETSRKSDIIIHIIKEIIYPTLFIGHPSVPLRKTKSEMFVTDSKWQCQNFDVNNYSIKVGDEIENGLSGRRNVTTIYDSNIKEKNGYSVEKIISLYKPCLLVVVETERNGAYNTGNFSLSKIESLYDDILLEILPSLDYESVIWDKARGVRKFEDDDLDDYTLKIILK